jgi:hypothetical protein
LAGRAAADEGMWLLPLMEKLNIRDMKARGLKLSAEDIYKVDGSSLKDAIVLFGPGCTGEIVSPEGLLLTNHHCGYDAIQGLSSVEHDYLKYGFWAQERGQEIPAPGLTVSFVRHIEDVTAQVVDGNTEALKESLEATYPGKTIEIKPLFGGNRFYLFVKDVYKDIRLVGTPPESIGRFGGQTDNWVWPRHTCDFSMFRVYAAPDGATPAEYSPENVPYRAPVHLEISLKGYKKGDYAMIMGFPGTTQRFMTTWEIDQMLDHENPARIAIREARQAVLSRYMAASDETRIKYSGKWAMSTNFWKKAIGMNRGIRKLGVRAQKQEIQDRFTAWAATRPEYREALPMIREAVAMRTVPETKNLIINEAALTGAEVLVAAMSFAPTIKKEGDKGALMERADRFYKDYDERVDRACARVMLKILFDSVPEALPASLEQYRDDVPALVEHIYTTSPFASRDRFAAYVEAGDFAALDADPAVQLSAHIVDLYWKLREEIGPASEKFAEGHRLFIAGLQEMEPSKKYYPDANSTLRITYGNILPYSPADAVFYDYRTFLRGVIAKEDPLNPSEFAVPARLKELYEARDFGPYAVGGDVPACFITNNDITGGNSGSPMLNARGRLTGLAFDGNWDAMSGDVAFEPNLQRTIAVDIRYVLFIIDKFAGAGHLLDEMTIVR